MKKYGIVEIANAINGKLLHDHNNITIQEVSIDSRNIRPGDLFFALQGNQHDGHQYVSQAVENGAAALVVNRPIPLENNVPMVVVQDTLEALQRLGAYNRRQLPIPVIGITGSNGKTSTKDLVASVLGIKYSVLKTKGNFNNEIGLPLALLELDESYQVAVLEMGMRGLGQIDALCRLANINGAVITTIGEAHLELLGTVENIARAKGEILDHVPIDGFGLVPADNILAIKQSARCRGEVITFGVECLGDYIAVNISTDHQGSKFTAVTPQGEVDISLPLLGKHNISNAMAAIAVGIKLGLTLEDVAKGIANAKVSAMRLQVVQGGDITIINDAYNANPDSTKAALNVLSDLAVNRRQVAVLGSMFELGPREQEGHYETGTAAKAVDLLVAVGEQAKNIATGALESGLDPEKVQWFPDNITAINYLMKSLKPGDVVLVKGSRGMKMEDIVNALLNR